MDDHAAAAQLVLEHTPSIPVWAQLPVYPQERMVPQFAPGMPGLSVREDTPFVDTAADRFGEQLLEFYEEYMAVDEGRLDADQSRFAFTPAVARGFFVLLERLKSLDRPPTAVKGQVTGPITFCTGMADEQRRAIFYNEQVRDAAVKLLAMKARWQTRKLKSLGTTAIVFIDEPALAGFGTSEHIGMSREAVCACLAEVAAAVHAEGGLAGVHVCANTDWSLLLDGAIDIVNFDAFAYFERFVLYQQELKRFFDAGRILAWGIVPTQDGEDIDRETVASLVERWEMAAAQVQGLGVDRATLLAQSLITPSCGAGSLSLAHATRVLELTRAVSDRLRDGAGFGNG
jgi:methionine synthase II (cobalamin-independent)